MIGDNLEILITLIAKTLTVNGLAWQYSTVYGSHRLPLTKDHPPVGGRAAARDFKTNAQWQLAS